MQIHKESVGGGGTCTWCKNPCKVIAAFKGESKERYHYESECCGAELLEEIWKSKDSPQ